MQKAMDALANVTNKTAGSIEGFFCFLAKRTVLSGLILFLDKKLDVAGDSIVAVLDRLEISKKVDSDKGNNNGWVKKNIEKIGAFAGAAMILGILAMVACLAARH